MKRVFFLVTTTGAACHTISLHEQTFLLHSSHASCWHRAGADDDRFTCCGLTCTPVRRGEESRSIAWLNESRRGNNTPHGAGVTVKVTRSEKPPEPRETNRYINVCVLQRISADDSAEEHNVNSQDREDLTRLYTP